MLVGLTLEMLCMLCDYKICLDVRNVIAVMSSNALIVLPYL